RVNKGKNNVHYWLNTPICITKFNISVRPRHVVQICNKCYRIKRVVLEGKVSYILNDIFLRDPLVRKNVNALALAIEPSLYKAVMIPATDIEAISYYLSRNIVESL